MTSSQHFAPYHSVCQNNKFGDAKHHLPVNATKVVIQKLIDTKLQGKTTFSFYM